MPEAASRDAQPGTSRRSYKNKAGRLMIIATSLTLMLPTYDYTRRGSARLRRLQAFTCAIAFPIMPGRTE